MSKVVVLSMDKPSTTTRINYIHKEKVFYNETNLQHKDIFT